MDQTHNRESGSVKAIGRTQAAQTWAAVMLSVLPLVSAAAASSDHLQATKVLGVWDDRATPMMSCFVQIEERAGKYQAVRKDCERGSSLFEGDINALRKTGPNQFHPADARLGHWFYVIAASGDLEVRDKKGVVRTITSTAPKSAEQRRAKLKSEGVAVGMQKDEVLASSWGKPTKVNRTQTANGVREQWVYRNGYLYFDGDTLVGIQN